MTGVLMALLILAIIGGFCYWLCRDVMLLHGSTEIDPAAAVRPALEAHDYQMVRFLEGETTE